jgi:small subunit ribosomal protein S2
MTKKELLVLKRERDKLDKTLGGIRDMSRIPSAVWIVDTKKEHIAVGEAHKLGIPVVAILDTNCDPDEVDYKIPGNDDAIRSVTLLTRVIADAVADGLMARVRMSQDGDEKPSVDGQLATDEPLADWERELLAGDATAHTPAPATGQVVEGAGTETSAPTSAAPSTEPTSAEPATATAEQPVEPAAATPEQPAGPTPEPAEPSAGETAPAADDSRPTEQA